MTHPENDRPDDEDGGTFKLKPSGPAKSDAPEPSPDHTMKLRKVGGANPAGAPPPPPPSPLGNPTGPANPPSAFNETTVMPPSGGAQTNFQPGSQPPPPGGQFGGQQPPGPGQQPYGQQQPQGQLPPQQQPPAQQGGAPGQVPAGVKRISLLGFISGGAGLLYTILLFALGGGAIVFISALPYIVTSLLVLGTAFALPRGMLTSKGMRTSGVVIQFVHGGWSLIALLNLLTVAGVLGGGFVAIGSVILLGVVGASGYAAWIYFKNQEAHAWIKGEPVAPGHQAPQPGQQPGGYPPPPPGYQGQQPPQQPPYGR